MNINTANYTTTKQELIQTQVKDILADLHSVRIGVNARKEYLRNKKEQTNKSIRASYSIDEVAEEFGMSRRMLHEYLIGKRIPRAGKAATNYKMAQDKYSFDYSLKRFFIRGY